MGNHHHVVTARQSAAIVSRVLVPTAGTGRKTAAMGVEHDRTLLAINARSPHVQEMAVLGCGRHVGTGQRVGVAVLNRLATVFERVPHARPWLQPGGRFEPVFALGGAGIGYAFENNDSVFVDASQLTLSGLGDHRLPANSLRSGRGRKGSGPSGKGRNARQKRSSPDQNVAFHWDLLKPWRRSSRSSPQCTTTLVRHYHTPPNLLRNRLIVCAAAQCWGLE